MTELTMLEGVLQKRLSEYQKTRGSPQGSPAHWRTVGIRMAEINKVLHDIHEIQGRTQEQQAEVRRLREARG